MTKKRFNFIPWLWSVGAALISSAVPFASAQASVSVRDVIIERVVDGDTVHAKDKTGKVVKIRMQGIDSAESHLVTDNGVASQMPWGKDAGDALARMLHKGDEVELEDFGSDKYGRTLGHIIIKGKNANIEQVRTGQAISYIICEIGGCTAEHLEDLHAETIMESCRKAQKSGLGVFNPANPLKEMPFEFRLKHQKRKADKFVGNYLTKEYVSPDRYKEIPVCDRIFFLSEQDAKNSGFTKK